MARRYKKFNNDDINIGPGSYNIKSNLLNNNNGKFGKTKRNFTNIDTNNLGPGSYNIGKNTYNLRNGNKFGASKRTDLINNANNLGPGSYNLNNNFKNRGFSFGRSKAVNNKFDNNLGPGAYNNPKNNFSGGIKFGKQTKLSFKNDNPLGPGSYNYKLKSGNGFSFGRQNRIDKVDEIKTIGYYNIPSTIPDIPRYLK